MLTRSPESTSSRAASVGAGLGVAALVAPGSFAVVLAALAAWVSWTVVPRPRLAWLGAPVALGALAVIGVTPRGTITYVASIALGLGIGMTQPIFERIERRTALVSAVVAAIAVQLASLWFAAACVVACAIATIVTADHERPRLGGRGVATTTVAVVLSIGLIAWVGANDPTVQWF